MKNLKLLIVIMILCGPLLIARAQSETPGHKDLNSPEMVKKLYEINELRKFYKEKMLDCQETYNLEREKNLKAIDSLTQIAVKMGDRSNEYVDHNLDLQAGIISFIKKDEKQQSEIALLKASKTKRFIVGPSAGYDIISNKFTFGASIVYRIITF